jgi:hypothetical protein
MVGLFMGSISGAYLNSVLMCFFVNLLRQHGLVYDLKKVMALGWPAFRAIILGFVPAVVMATYIEWLVPSLTSVVPLSIPVGAFVSAVLVHRFFLTVVGNSRIWNFAILTLTGVQISLSGLAIFLIQVSK